MLTVSHVVVGAALGSTVAHLPHADLIAFAAGWASHYVLDTIPHWENWFGQEIHGFPSGTALQDLPKIVIIGGIFDGLIALALLIFIYQQVGNGPVWQSPLLWGALGGFLPDLLDNVPFVNSLAIKLPLVKYERRLHNRIHISEAARRQVPYLTGLLTQLIVISLGLWVLF